MTKKFMQLILNYQNKPDGVTEISDYINIKTTNDGEIVGIELTDASKKIQIKTLFNFEIDSKSLNKELKRKIAS